MVVKGQFSTGDHAVYIPEQAIVHDPLIEELGLTGKLAGRQRNRVKAVRLRGEVSQGIVCRPRQLHGADLTQAAAAGTDFAELLGITKWVPPVPAIIGVVPDRLSTVRDMEAAVLVIAGVADFGFAAVLETFNMANALLPELESPPAPWRVRTASLGTSVRSAHGHLVPTTPLDDLSGAIDVMIIPAIGIPDAEGLVDLISAPANLPLLERISEAQQHGTHLAAACTGTFFLAEAGVLDGLAATTSWWLGPSFRRRYPRVDVHESRTLCHAKGVTTAGASLSHLDLALSLVSSVSPALAEIVARYLAIADRGPQIEYSIPEVVARGDSLVASFECWVRERVADQFAIRDAAKALGITTRSLQRATQAELGMSPRDFVDEIRLERATRLLRTTNLSVDAIAAKVGYLNAGTLRALFRRRRGRTIAEVRGSNAAWGPASRRS
ncbi:helix-turn-helix domain-containing protein [Nocardia jiangxiensis]|uniref:Helix-turn-helix domain-containing protein n=1 Tax=Nocardia jiangxiensis TaxID=282685 RepID=A0ABW6S9R5_9NOCA